MEKRSKCVDLFAVSEVDETSESIVKHNHYHVVDLIIDLLEKAQIFN